MNGRVCTSYGYTNAEKVDTSYSKEDFQIVANAVVICLQTKKFINKIQN
jgi:hypothetical protein